MFISSPLVFLIFPSFLFLFVVLFIGIFPFSTFYTSCLFCVLSVLFLPTFLSLLPLSFFSIFFFPQILLLIVLICTTSFIRQFPFSYHIFFFYIRSPLLHFFFSHFTLYVNLHCFVRLSSVSITVSFSPSIQCGSIKHSYLIIYSVSLTLGLATSNWIFSPFFSLWLTHFHFLSLCYLSFLLHYLISTSAFILLLVLSSGGYYSSTIIKGSILHYIHCAT